MLVGKTVAGPVSIAGAAGNGGLGSVFEGGSVRALLGRGPGVVREGVMGGGGE